MSTSDKLHNATLSRALFAICLVWDDRQTLQSQLLRALREILTNRDHASARLPSSRTLAEELSVSRTTVQTVYEQLASEGYLYSRRGSGTYVANDLPHLRTPDKRAVVAPPAPQSWRPFEIGLPDQKLFPHRSWARHLEQSWRRSDPHLHGRKDPFGHYSLRQAICEHLTAWRGLTCRPEQVVITSGARDSLELLFRGILKDRLDVALEDPGWPRIYDILAANGRTGRPVRIDDDGLNAAHISPHARCVIVTPSRHFPTGVSMPLTRRLALIEWANTTGGVVIEDDYDSEFRYRGKPLPSLAGLDQNHNTVYLGSFSKLISPSIRIAYLVLPERYIGPARAYLELTGTHASLIPQPALAAFLSSGEFAVHLRRARRTYAKRQQHLLNALRPLSETLVPQPDASGMHLCVPLHSQATVTDVALSEIGRGVNLRIDALSTYATLPSKPQGLLLGYAAFDEATLDAAAKRLIEAIRRRHRDPVRLKPGGIGRAALPDPSTATIAPRR